MRIRRFAIPSALVAAVLLISGCTLGPIQEASIGDGSLGLQGATVTVPVSVTCIHGWNVAYADITSLVQSTDLKLAQGSGYGENPFPGVPCTGTPQTITVTVFDNSPWAFRRGTAAASGDVAVYNEETGDLIQKDFDYQEIQIRKPTVQPAPAKRVARKVDERYMRS